MAVETGSASNEVVFLGFNNLNGILYHKCAGGGKTTLLSSMTVTLLLGLLSSVRVWRGRVANLMTHCKRGYGFTV